MTGQTGCGTVGQKWLMRGRGVAAATAGVRVNVIIVNVAYRLVD